MCPRVERSQRIVEIAADAIWTAQHEKHRALSFRLAGLVPFDPSVPLSSAAAPRPSMDPAPNEGESACIRTGETLDAVPAARTRVRRRGVRINGNVLTSDEMLVQLQDASQRSGKRTRA